MLSNSELIERFMDKISDRIATDLKQSIVQALEREIRQNISRALMQGEFYKTMNSELQSGLKNIYREISHAKKQEGCDVPSPPDGQTMTTELISEASDQLDEILKATEEAAVEVMDIVEGQMDAQAEMSMVISKIQSGEAGSEELAMLATANQRLSEDLLKIMTALSFQDLTGQRIKRIVSAIKQVEKITLDLFLTTGLKIKGMDEHPDKDIQTLEAETKQKVSSLQGPSKDTNQKDVDDLLSQLGL